MVPRLAKTALASPSATWLQNFPYKLHTFIHCSSGCPTFANIDDCAAAATAANVKYASICTYQHIKIIAMFLVDDY